MFKIFVACIVLIYFTFKVRAKKRSDWRKWNHSVQNERNDKNRNFDENEARMIFFRLKWSKKVW
jgi:hypothetical protein